MRKTLRLTLRKKLCLKMKLPRDGCPVPERSLNDRQKEEENFDKLRTKRKKPRIPLWALTVPADEFSLPKQPIATKRKIHGSSDLIHAAPTPGD